MLHWPKKVLRSGDLPPRFEGPALRFAYAMRDELIVADARILQAQCEELKERPARDRGRPAPPHPAHRQALSRRADRRRHTNRAASPAPRCRGIFRAAVAPAGADDRPRVPRRDRVRRLQAGAETVARPAASSRPTPRSTSSAPKKATKNAKGGGIVAEHDFNPRAPRRPPARSQAQTEWDVFKPVPRPPTRQRRLPGHHRLRPPRPATLVAPPSHPSGTQPLAAPPSALRAFLPSPRPSPPSRHPATRSRGPRRRAGGRPESPETGDWSARRKWWPRARGHAAEDGSADGDAEPRSRSGQGRAGVAVPAQRPELAVVVGQQRATCAAAAAGQHSGNGSAAPPASVSTPSRLVTLATRARIASGCVPESAGETIA